MPTFFYIASAAWDLIILLSFIDNWNFFLLFMCLWGTDQHYSTLCTCIKGCEKPACEIPILQAPHRERSREKRLPCKAFVLWSCFNKLGHNPDSARPLQTGTSLGPLSILCCCCALRGWRAAVAQRADSHPACPGPGSEMLTQCLNCSSRRPLFSPDPLLPPMRSMREPWEREGREGKGEERETRERERELYPKVWSRGKGAHS